jgi:hypothetical protein
MVTNYYPISDSFLVRKLIKKRKISKILGK